jgi:cytochrome c5
MSDNTHEEAHTGPIKNPKQLLLAVFFSFVVPVFAIIGLVYYVSSEPSRPPAPQPPAWGGVSEDDRAQGLAERIQKVGMVEIRDANRALQSGEAVFKAQCTACHAAGVANAPKVGDAGAWGPRIKTGLDALVNSALKGKGAMGPQGGGDFDDVEIARAVVLHGQR